MQFKTKGIILHHVKYSDSSIIVTIYTEEYGRVAYLVHGINRKKSNIRAALLLPLSIVSMEVTHSPKREVQYIKEIRVSQPHFTIPFDPIKNSIALFISELLYKIVRHGEKDVVLFRFLEESIGKLDSCTKGIGNFHLVFLINLTKLLGFEPRIESDNENCYFDLLNGCFEKEKPTHSQFVEREFGQMLYRISRLDYDCLDALPMNSGQRNKILSSILEYYSIHLHAASVSLRSVEVLQELWR